MPCIDLIADMLCRRLSPPDYYGAQLFITRRAAVSACIWLLLTIA
jgi:hypothetical protein